MDTFLNEEDVNISDKTNISCNFTDGFELKNNNNSFNKNDKIGFRVILLLMFIIVCTLYILSISNGIIIPSTNRGIFDFNKYKTHAIIALIVGCIILIVDFIIEPIHIIYLMSYIITLNVRTPPFLDLDKYFPNHTKLENKETFDKIRLETVNILNQKDKLSLTKNTYGNDEIGGGDVQKNNEDGWRIYVVKLGKNNFAEETMPELTKVLKDIPEVVSCAVSILPSKKAIPIHVGYSKGVMRYQLGTIVPKDRENVFICVNGEKYNWTEGEGVLFDDTYPHKVYNNTNEDRVVLYMDVIRPFLNPFLDVLNKFVINLVSNSSIAKKEVARTEKQITIDTFINHSFPYL
jgi:aspartyl/asparaginyl beta-hydroxylase (cupin superfamily)